MNEFSNWEQRFEQFLAQQAEHFDAAHDLSHIRRVVANAKRLAAEEQAQLEVVVPAAWLHDCVTVAKNSPLRPVASRLAAEAAGQFLEENGYPTQFIPAIQHAIEAHSFTAAIPPLTVEAKVVQDADRLDAIGAIGISRCLMLGGAMRKPLYNEREPLPHERAPDDTIYVIDHFYVKLLKLVDSMTTHAGRAEAQRRTEFMRQFLGQLGGEIAGDFQ